MTHSNKKYHHGDVPSALMEAAIKSIRLNGIERLSLRALARDIGISQTAPYRHFKDKTQLLVKLAVEGFNTLVANKLDNRTGDYSEENLIEVGVNYVQFAKQHPEHYKLMFGSSIENRRDHEELIDASHAAFQCIFEQVEEGIKIGFLINEDPEILAKSCWTTVHGIASLYIDGFFENINYNFDEFLRMQVTFIVRGISKNPKAIKA
ncbi:MAG: AcrR family transcriptional regulator [Bermanella sp.]|jgi:AcrR family transcriptional regulator